MAVLIAGMYFITCYNTEIIVGTKINDALFQLQIPISRGIPALLQFPVEKIFVQNLKVKSGKLTAPKVFNLLNISSR